MLINEFLGDPAALALLQFTLIKLWDKRERNHITWASYRAIGGGQGAVEMSAEAAYGAQDFDEEDRDLTRRIFLRLVRPSLTRELVASGVPEAALADGPEARERVRKIVERFEKEQLLKVQTNARGERLVEVTHGALLRRWPRLLQWLEDSRIELLQRQRIGVAAAQWREQGRDPSTLWSGVLLTAALSIREQLSPTELEFVEASRRAADRRRNRNRTLLTIVIVLLALGLLREMRRTLQERFSGRETKAALNLERGERRLEGGDPAGAFLFFHQAAVDDPKARSDWPYRLWRFFIFPQVAAGDPEGNDLVHRRRLGATWRQIPRVKHFLNLKDLSHSELSPSGEYLLGTSRDAVRVWRLSESDSAQGTDPLGNHPHGRVMWASFHPDPEQPLIAIAMADPDLDGKPAGHGQIVIFDAKSNQFVGEPIRFADGVPQKAWFGPEGGDSDRLLVVSQPAGARSGEVSIWNLHNARREAVLRDHTLPVNWASFSRDGMLVVTAAGDLDGGERGEARVWDWKNDRSAPLQHDGGPIRYAEFASGVFDDNCDHVLTAEGANDGGRGAARVWSVLRRDNEPFLQISALTAPLSHRGAVNRAHFSPNGLWVATASSDRTARLWHVRTQKQALSFEHDGDVNDVVFSPDGRHLATAGRDRTARIWEVATGRMVHPPLNHSETVNELAYSRDGRSLLTSSKHLGRIWTADQDEPKAPILEASDSILTAVSGDGQRVLTVSKPDDKKSTLELWETDTGNPIASVKLNGSEPIRCVALDANGNRLAVASRDSSGTQPVLRIFEVVDGGGQNGGGRFKETSQLQGEILSGSDVVSAAFDRDGGQLAVLLRKPGEEESRVGICDVAAGTVRILPGQDPSLVSAIQLSPSGRYLLACFSKAGEPEGRARLWKLDSNSATPSELHHATGITTAAFSPDERLLLTGSTDDDARLWSIADGGVAPGEVLREQGSEHTHTADLTRVLFSPDGRRALTASKDQTAILWDVTNGRRIAVLRHSAYVSDVKFSGRGDLILTSSGEPKLRAWSADTGELLARFTPAGEVFEIGFAPDDNSVFAIGQNFARRSGQAETGTGDQSASGPRLREVRPLTWSFAPLQGDLAHAGERGVLLAARQIEEKSLEKAVTEELPEIWRLEGPGYQALFDREPDPTQYHRAAARECETTKQWSAAAWHLTKLLELTQDDASRASLLLRRAEAYAAADNWADSLPRCIADRKTVIALGHNSASDYRALAEACIDYGNASGKPEQWDLAIEALREGVELNPADSRNFILLGEAFAGKRDFAQAEEAFQQALALGSPAAPARLAFISWIMGDEQGRKRYRDLCLALNDPSKKSRKAMSLSLLWPSVITNAFEKDDQDRAFREELVRLARELSDEAPSNFFRRNTLGAALYRAGRYEEAIKELEAARAANLAERVDTLSQYYDRLIRIPISRTPEGRAQDWAFLAMANARLNRRSEAWDWMRKLRDSPELTRAVQTRKRDYPVSYDTLAVELLYDEALDVLRRQPDTRQRAQ